MEYYPPIELHDEGWADTGDGHSVHWMVSGNPQGIPAVIVHGGPGSGSGPGQRRMWDPDAYRIIQIDQRGCGGSTPSASDLSVPMANNTTAHLIRDMEQVREHLGVDRWVIWGGSWGTTLALAYAQRNTERVLGLVLVFMFLGRTVDIHRLYHEMGRYFPAEWREFVDGAGGYDDNLIAVYDRLLNESHDPRVQSRAAYDFSKWESVVSSLDPGWVRSTDRIDDLAYGNQVSRITAHYFAHDVWLEPNQILRDAPRLADTPGIIIHGYDDRANPFEEAWLLAHSWPKAELVGLRGVGHSPSSPAARDAVLAATEGFIREFGHL